MQNLINDLKSADGMFSSSQNTGFDITLSQPLIHPKPIKKPLIERNRKIEYRNDTDITNSDKLLLAKQSQENEIIATDENVASSLSMQPAKKSSEKRNYIKKSSQPEYFKASQYIQKNQSDISQNQSPQQNCVRVMSQCELSEQATNRIIFKLKEYTSKNQRCLNQISVPRNTASQIEPSKISDKSIIATASDCSFNANKNNMIEHTNIINVFKKLFQKLNQCLDIIEKRESENHAMLLQLTKAKNRRVQLMPKCFPFKSVESLIQFDNAGNEIYDEVIDYFIYLGGLNPIDCAAIYFKCAFENVEKISLEVTWHGTKHLKALKVTRFAHACEDAISSNLNFPKPRRDEFDDAMIKALKSTKERFRRQQKRPRCLENDEPKETFMRRAKILNKR
ncbi:hypothetical protein ACS0PU_010414 [Formica fusca]